MTEYLEQAVIADIRKVYGGFFPGEENSLVSALEQIYVETGSWYDGYTFTRYRHIYNPQSVVEAMRRHRLSGYWTATETYEALKIYMDMDYGGLRTDIARMLGGSRIAVNTGSFRNDMRNFRTKDDVLTLLIHLGYLAYDSEKKEAFIPNREIMGEFENAMSVGDERKSCVC